MKRVLNSFIYAYNGIKYVFKTQNNFKIQVSIFILAIILAEIYHISNYEWLILILISALVMSLEIINTSIENLVDLVTNDFHSNAEKAKDTAAAAVLLVSFLAILIGLIIFIPYIF